MTTLGEYAKEIVQEVLENDWTDLDLMMRIKAVAGEFEEAEMSIEDCRWFWQELANQFSAARRMVHRSDDETVYHARQLALSWLSSVDDDEPDF